MENRNCIDFDPNLELDKEGCLTQTALETLMADVVSSFTKVKITGEGACICSTDNCNTYSAAAALSAGVIVSFLVVIGALFVNY